MKCERCKSVLVLKSTSDCHGVYSRYWRCPVCGAEQVEESEIRDVILK